MKAGFRAQIWACYQLNKCPPTPTPPHILRCPLNPSVRLWVASTTSIKVQCRCLYFILWVKSTDGGNEEVLPLCLQGGEAGCQQGDQQQTGEQQSWSPKKAPGKSREVSARGAEGRTSLCVKNASICIRMIFWPVPEALYYFCRFSLKRYQPCCDMLCFMTSSLLLFSSRQKNDMRNPWRSWTSWLPSIWRTWSRCSSSGSSLKTNASVFSKSCCWRWNNTWISQPITG